MGRWGGWGGLPFAEMNMLLFSPGFKRNPSLGGLKQTDIRPPKTTWSLGCGSKLNDRRGKPGVVHVSTCQGNAF